MSSTGPHYVDAAVEYGGCRDVVHLELPAALDSNRRGRVVPGLYCRVEDGIEGVSRDFGGLWLAIFPVDLGMGGCLVSLTLELSLDLAPNQYRNIERRLSQNGPLQGGFKAHCVQWQDCVVVRQRHGDSRWAQTGELLMQCYPGRSAACEDGSGHGNGKGHGNGSRSSLVFRGRATTAESKRKWCEFHAVANDQRTCISNATGRIGTRRLAWMFTERNLFLLFLACLCQQGGAGPSGCCRLLAPGRPWSYPVGYSEPAVTFINDESDRCP